MTVKRPPRIQTEKILSTQEVEVVEGVQEAEEPQKVEVQEVSELIR